MRVDRRPIDQMILDVGAPVFLRLQRLFEEETRGAVVEMRDRFRAGDWRELGRRAHSLKHATSSFGLLELAAIAALLEQAADSGRGDDAQTHVLALESTVDADLATLGRLIEEMELSGGS